MARIQRKKSAEEKRQKLVKTLQKKHPEQEVSTSAGEGTSAIPTAATMKKKRLFKKGAAVASHSAGKPRWRFIEQSIQFLREVKIELKKVTWPSRKQTIASTAVVIVLVLVISLFLGLVDMGLSSIIRALLQ